MPDMTGAERRKLGNKLGGLRKYHPEANDEIKAIQATLATEKLAAYIKRVVDAAPPLTREQRDMLASLLEGGA